MSHYQIKRDNNGMICLRAPGHPDGQIEGFLFRQDRYGYRRPTGHFAQVVRFPDEMGAWHTHIEYRVADGVGGWLYFIGQLPTPTAEWQHIYNDSITDHDPNWYLADEAPPSTFWADLELLNDEKPAAPAPDPEFAAWLNDSLIKIQEAHSWYNVHHMAAELGTNIGHLARIINGEAVAEDFFIDNARRVVGLYLEAE